MHGRTRHGHIKRGFRLTRGGHIVRAHHRRHLRHRRRHHSLGFVGRHRRMRRDHRGRFLGIF